MLLSSLSKQSDCTVVVTGMAKNKDNHEWILSPGGKHIMKLSELHNKTTTARLPIIPHRSFFFPISGSNPMRP